MLEGAEMVVVAVSGVALGFITGVAVTLATIPRRLEPTTVIAAYMWLCLLQEQHRQRETEAANAIDVDAVD